jgi:iron complex outermembrane receptor protein
VDSYGVLNLVFSMRSRNDSYTISAFVNNALDEGYFVNGGNQFGNFGNQQATDLWPARDFERYAGVRATFEF